MTAFQKLQKLLIEDGDINIPIYDGDNWILSDENDTDIAEGKTLEEAAENLAIDDSPSPVLKSNEKPVGRLEEENERLRNELNACRMALIKWLDYVEDLKEITKFLTK